MKRLSFTLKFHKASTHYVQVHVWPTRAIMRCILTKKGHKDSSDTDAACWQPNKHEPDGLIAEVHFGRDIIALETIAHEMAHAAYHRAKVIGCPDSSKEFQEWIADGTGTLTAACIMFLEREGIKLPAFKKRGKR